MKITVVGAGYVGLVQSIGLGMFGYHIVCYDTDKTKIEKLKKSVIPFYEKGLQEKFFELSKQGKIEFVSDENCAYKNNDIIFFCVGTPSKANGEGDISYLMEAINRFLEINNKDCILVIKSTVPIGTAEYIEKYVKSKSNYKVDVVSNPEFLSQGSALFDFINTKRIIIGANDNLCATTVSNLYKKLNKPIIITSFINAELIKYASNCFLAMKISYINEISNICDLFNGDISVISNAMKMDDRIGSKYLDAGIGFGGSCLSKDIKALISSAKSKKYKPVILESIIERNNKQVYYLLDKCMSLFDVQNKIISVLGLAFKPESDDLRESIAIKNIIKMQKLNCFIKVYDPKAMGNARKALPSLNFCDSIDDCLLNSDFCFIFTEWNEIKNLSPDVFLQQMKSPIVFDGRNCFNKSNMLQKKVKYFSVGR